MSDALVQLTNELNALRPGQDRTFSGAAFRLALEVPPTNPSVDDRPAVLAEDHFRQIFPGWEVYIFPSRDAYRVQKPEVVLMPGSN
jgi:hypothetical protein